MIEIIAYGGLGLIVGSFLNVVTFRWGTGRSIIGVGRPASSPKAALKARVDSRVSNGKKEIKYPNFVPNAHRAATPFFSAGSACMMCGREIFWYDLIPVLSWIYLRGRCRFCGSRISLQYPFVELMTALLFVTTGFSPLPTLFKLIGLAIVSILLAIAVYDLRHTIIPDSWVWTFNLLAFLFPLLASNYSLFAVLAGPFTALPLFILWAISRGKWMGFGDVKLALGIGWLLGAGSGIVAVFLAFIIGAVVGLMLIFFSSELWRKIVWFTPTPTSQKLMWGFTMKSEVPFGPFLIMSCLIVWLAQMHGIPIPLPV